VGKTLQSILQELARVGRGVNSRLEVGVRVRGLSRTVGRGMLHGIEKNAHAVESTNRQAIKIFLFESIIETLKA
jgi:hypothetical protein